MKILIEKMEIETALEKLASIGWAVDLIYDDDGNWAFSDGSFGSVRTAKTDDSMASHYTKAEDWKPSIREAWIHFVNTRNIVKHFTKKE